MSNAFGKEINIAFDEMMAGFDDELKASKNVSIYKTDQTMMARTNDIIWAPAPYIMQSFDGMDQSANFPDATQLVVPSTIGFEKSSNWKMDAREMRDAMQEGRLFEKAKQKLASDINIIALNIMSQGSLTIKRTSALSGFDDVAQCDTLMNQTGVLGSQRYMGLSSASYNNMASGLIGTARSFNGGKSDKAFEDGFVGRISSFDTYKFDYCNRIGAAAGSGITINTLDAGLQYYTPAATRVASTGEFSNVDNRYQTVTVSSTTSVAANDRFTIANVNNVHQITKADQGSLKTFRVVSVDSSTTMTISPPLITNQVSNAASAQYQNCVVTSKSATAALVWLNTAAADINPFWHKDALRLLPGRYAVPDNAGAKILRGTTDQGFEVVFQQQYDMQKMKEFFRVDVLLGAANVAPEMSGILLGAQT